jgi:NitT/TauT family transport system permease protein
MSEGFRKVLYAAIGGVVLLGAMELIGRAGLAGMTWPPLSESVAYIIDPAHARLLTDAVIATMSAAAVGALLGIVGGSLLAVVGLQVGFLRPGLDRTAALAEAMPAIAIAPFLALTVGRDATPMIIPALGVGFIIYLSLSSGFAGIPPVRHDVFTALGASRTGRFMRLQLPNVLPSFFDGLALAAPAAVLGAMIGEFFGASRGLGVLVVSAMQNFQIPLLWAAAILSVGCSLIAYTIFTILQRQVRGRFA